MKISTSKTEAMVLNRKRVLCPLQVGGEVLPQVEEFMYPGVLFTYAYLTFHETAKEELVPVCTKDLDGSPNLSSAAHQIGREGALLDALQTGFIPGPVRQPIPADGPQVSQGIALPASPDNSEARQSRHTSPPKDRGPHPWGSGKQENSKQ
ncbi:hypothetical protein D4764_08G0008330 [Takifugu flavidus]|uniref:Uncharacterized protein n=1 Tax=Takifugu flavidus TaxID=433684 RepID=A0A5C6MP01_9TELE|nr:hypothetical protein D4764_08G0008330 [Takifugu flavidus]